MTRSDPRGVRARLIAAAGMSLLGFAIPFGLEAEAPARGDPGWTLPAPGYAWSFPRDHHAHPDYRTEWWYVTGQVSADGDSTARYGFQFTIFRVGILRDVPGWDSAWSTRGAVLGHIAVTDLGRGVHVFSETLVREMPFLGGFPDPPDSILAWCRPPGGTEGRWEILHRDGSFRIRAMDAGRGSAIDLTLVPEKPAVLQGPGGLSRKDRSGNAASLYYTLPRLRARGTLDMGGSRIPVSGSSWLDREWSSQGLAEGQEGWDWLSLQLEDGRDLMLYRLRGSASDADFGKGTLIDPAGVPRYLDQDAWSMIPGRIWKSPATGSAYPVEWSVSVPTAGLSFRVAPLLDAQENVGSKSGGIAYWEGAVIAIGPDGRRLGRGYLELTGYGRRARPDL